MPVTREGIHQKVFRDPTNSTSVPLGAGEIWTGQATENRHSHVQVAAFSDTAGTIGMHFSTDGGETYDSVLRFEVTAGESFFKILVKGQREYFTSFNNQGGQQTALRLQTDFGTFTAPMSPSSGGMLVELAGPLGFTPSGGEAFPVIDKQQETAADTMLDILDELRVMNMHMAQITGVNWNKEDL